MHAGVTRAIWNEAENEIETECYEDALADLITRECVTDNFCAETLDDHVARVCLAVGLGFLSLSALPEIRSRAQTGA